MSFEQYVEHGKNLKKLNAFIISLKTGAKSSKRGKAKEKALKHLSELRSELDNLLFQDFSDRDSQELGAVFYGSDSPP